MNEVNVNSDFFFKKENLGYDWYLKAGLLKLHKGQHKSFSKF